MNWCIFQEVFCECNIVEKNTKQEKCGTCVADIVMMLYGTYGPLNMVYRCARLQQLN